MDGPKTNTPKKKPTRRRTKPAPLGRIEPGALYESLVKFGETYQISAEQDFLQAASIYAQEYDLIQQMRDQIEREGLTTDRVNAGGGIVPIAHPLLAELPKHLSAANSCLSTIADLILKRGARVEKAKRALDAFRLH